MKTITIELTTDQALLIVHVLRSAPVNGPAKSVVRIASEMLALAEMIEGSLQAPATPPQEPEGK